MYSSIERKALGQVIRALRELEGLSREELAEGAALGPDMIAKIEQGAKAPSGAALKRISSALGVTSVELTSRSLSWMSLQDGPDASGATLRAIATGIPLMRAVGGKAGGLVGGVGLVLGTAAAATVRAAAKERSDVEAALRAELERRIQQADNLQDLRDLHRAIEDSG